MRNKILLFTVFITFLIGHSFGQNYQFTTLADGSSTTTCKGTFTASGAYNANGATHGQYNNNTTKTVTFCSGTPGVPIRISFIDWNLETGFDYLRIYDGTGTTGTLLGTINGGPTDIYNAGAKYFTSTGTCLTVQLTSDGSTTGFWDAIIGCKPQGCGSNLPADDFCGSAPQICDLNGYCGNTSGWYTRDNGQIEAANLNQFCGSIENNSWLTFVASATTATLNLNSTNCAVTTTGIQAEVFSTTNCSTFTSKSNCVSQNASNGAFTLTATALTVGTRYYVMVDGFAGNICDYSVTANTGVQVLSFSTSATGNQICEGGTATITVNGAIAGSTYSWTASPAGSIVGATNTATITVNPTVTTTYSVLVTQPNGCLTQTETFTLNVNPKKTTTVNATICQGQSYTVCGQSYTTQGIFTKVCTTSKGCDSTVTLNLTVTPNTTPTFTQLGPYCVNATPGTLPTTSNNGITGTWNPATISTASQGTTTYTFTPTAGQCATTATMAVVVNPNIVPTFTQLGPYCVNATPGTLPTTSNNGITGTWNPATINTASQGTTTYTFTPTAGLCATTATMAVVVNPNIVPTFTQLGPYCVNATPGTLPTTSNNGITGTWNPATISTASQGTTTYTFTPTAGLCATTATMAVVVNPNIVPTFTQLGPYCVNATPGTLPTTSNNGITGTWNPATINTASQGTTTYTFTPTAGLCATTATMAVVVNPNIVPTFTQLGPYCVNATPGTLSTTSNNGITGTWNPTTISTASQGTTTYTFTPTAGLCATTATMAVVVNPNIVPTFTQLGPYCVNATPGTLPTTSNNGITGTWNPATISTASQGTTTYTFTPTAGQCATTATMAVVVNPNIVPTFTQLGPYCVNATPGTLPTTSNNGITGTWNPATINTASQGTTTYTFTPTAGLCATTATMAVVVNPNIVPTFTQLGPYCVNATPGTLPTTSNNGITGTWNPATISTASQGTTTYTFTPTAGLCATTATMAVVVNPNIVPTFTQLGPYCVNATPGTLPTTSNNGITGTWNPATINTASQGTTTYTFTPTAGLCATTATMAVVVNPNIVPTFTQLGPYCVNATPGTLSTTSNNGITGTWNPTTISTASQGTTTYTFTPTAGLCATTATMAVVVNPNIVPTFTQLGPYCVNATPGTLPTTSNNGITGTWNPAAISTASQGTTTYTFTPTAGLCATTATMAVVVNPNIVPTFTQLGPYCVNATPGTLPTTSNNGITGTWNPAAISTASQGTTTYTFTPTAGLCATTATMAVVVNPNIVPTFTQLGPYCVNATPGTLPTTSNNGITGTWNPAAISTASQGTTTYTFTPTAGLCATTATMAVVVNSNPTPIFTQLGPYCVNATPGTLPTTSNNGITGTWNPATISTASQGTTTYTFTPTVGQCGTTATMAVVVNPNIVPTFTQLGPYCVNATPGTLPTTSNNGITGTWNPAAISTASQGTTTYTFTPTAGLCATTATMAVVVNPNITPIFTQLGPYCVNATPGTLPTTSNNGITGTWNPAAINTASQGTTTYTFTPTAGLCATTATMAIVVNPNIVPTFTQLGPYCVNATPGTLPTTSNNGITGTWNPATVSTASQGTTTYTFTPTAGLCATTATMAVVVNSNPTPTFTQLGPYCVNATPGTLPTTSNNGITGTWNPATISTASQGTITYTFTPTAGQCGSTATMSVVVNPNITPTFTQLGPYCVNATPGTLPTTSNNGITGTWNPATIGTASQGTTTYTFTPTAGLCATTATMAVVVNPNILPTFTQLGPYCVNATPGTLPTTSNNGITGTWNPATISTASQGTTTYTFTPATGLCATTATMAVVVNPNIVPTFTQLGPYCVGVIPGTLPTTSNNGITGTWNPATISTASQGTTTYTFTPTAGLCATTATMAVVVNSNPTPTFIQLGPYCVGATPGTLPTTSNNGITGTWNPATVTTTSQGTTTYTFTPTAGQCGTTATMAVVVNPNIVPTFTQLGPYCVGATPAALPTTSNNGITGTWNPATVSTASQGTTTYTFTPAAGLCATTATMAVVVNPNITPTFTQLGPYCAGARPGTLPTTSNNGITGTWNPATISTASQGTTTYTFTPTAGLCATTATMAVVVNPNIVPTFTQLGAYCQGAAPDNLPTTSDNGITGTWNPATISTASQGITTYTFTPTAGLCATTTTMEVVVNSNPTPTFTQLGAYCQGATPDNLPTTSNNGITGTWNPVTISTAAQGTTTYTFTPTVGQCGTTATMDVVVNPSIITNLTTNLCSGDSIQIGSQTFNSTGNYSVVLSSSTGCDSTVNLDLTVIQPIVTPLNARFCEGESYTVGDSIYTKTGTYSNVFKAASTCDSIVILNLIVDPSVITNLKDTICNGQSVTIGNQSFSATGTYSVTLQAISTCDSIVNLNLTVRDAIQTTSLSQQICSGESYSVGNQTFTENGNYTVHLQSSTGCDSTVLLNLVVNNLPSIDAVANKPAVNPGEQVQLNVTTTESLNYNWTPADLLNNPAIQNPTATLNASTWFVVTATNGQTRCSFTDSVFVELNQLECSKENIFIPNAFTPNGDGINDVFIPRSTILKSMKLIIIDRWGHQVFESTDLNVGWDGTYKGQPDEVDSYGYYFVGECIQGEKITLKGNVTLLR